ncbi:MAG: arylsulfatase [Daejeonella sp.]|uniref:arylsulfatase n=1 Tax=Daejeonella sp. TaxID=2805397 RepID=UPI002736C208|nr:arylsulfatase [Daejeonella sp.]MDP3469013.1 arylsulfatase [Daejeonella sp.]
MSFLKLNFLFIVLTLSFAVQNNYAQKRPNILLIMTDDQGVGDLGIHNNDVLKTPNMDAIAKQGAEFKQFIVNFNCSPTRASMLTGRDNYRTGVVGVTETSHLMKASEITIAKLLSEAGYSTGIFGKWHLGDSYPMRPSDKGFQETLIHKGGGIGQASDPPGNSYFNPILEHNNVRKVFDGYCDDIFADATLSFIDKNKDKPFFAFYATNLPHFPLTVSDKWADPFRKMGLHELNARTYGMIANVDANIGRLLAKLKELGIEDNTIVIFMSDNGPRTKRTKNDLYPDRYSMNLRGTKTSVYENGIRSPFFIKWSEKIAQGVKYTNLAAHIDVMPTLLEACNVPVPNNLKLDGISLMPLLNGEVKNLPEREIFIQGHAGSEPFKYFHFTVRGQRYKLISPTDDPYGTIRRPTDADSKKLIANLELYDLEKDSSEINNIAKQHPDIVKSLLIKYENWFDKAIKDRGQDWPQRIYLGTSFQKNVQLSRFDWGGPGAFGNQLNKFGYWEVYSTASQYRIMLRFQKAPKSGMAYIKYKGVEKNVPVLEGNTSVIFDNIELPAGPGRFEAFLKFDPITTGVQFVDVERIN